MTNLEWHKFLSPKGEYSQKIFVPFFSTVKNAACRSFLCILHPVHLEFVFPKTKCRFLNKGLSYFNLALDLGFLTKAHNNTFFKPQFIFYAPYLSEKIGYCRYITVYRDFKTNPEYPCYPSWHQF